MVFTTLGRDIPGSLRIELATSFLMVGPRYGN